MQSLFFPVVFLLHSKTNYNPQTRRRTVLTNAESSASDDTQGLLPMSLAHNNSGSQEQQVIIQNSQSYVTTPTSTNTSRYYEPSAHGIGISPSQDEANNNEPGIISSTSVLNLGNQSHSVQTNGFVYEYYKLSDKDNMQWR